MLLDLLQQLRQPHSFLNVGGGHNPHIARMAAQCQPGGMACGVAGRNAGLNQPDGGCADVGRTDAPACAQHIGERLGDQRTIGDAKHDVRNGGDGAGLDGVGLAHVGFGVDVTVPARQRNGIPDVVSGTARTDLVFRHHRVTDRSEALPDRQHGAGSHPAVVTIGGCGVSHCIVAAQGIGGIISSQHRRGWDVGVVVRGHHRHADRSRACSRKYRAAALGPRPGVVLPGSRSAVEIPGVAKPGDIAEVGLDRRRHTELEIGLLGRVQLVCACDMPLGDRRLVIGGFGITAEQVVFAQLAGDGGQHRIAGAVQEDLTVDGVPPLAGADIDGGDPPVGDMHLLHRGTGQDVDGRGQVGVVSALQPDGVDGVGVAPLSIGFAAVNQGASPVAVKRAALAGGVVGAAPGCHAGQKRIGNDALVPAGNRTGQLLDHAALGVGAAQVVVAVDDAHRQTAVPECVGRTDTGSTAADDDHIILPPTGRGSGGRDRPPDNAVPVAVIALADDIAVSLVEVAVVQVAVPCPDCAAGSQDGNGIVVDLAHVVEPGVDAMQIPGVIQHQLAGIIVIAHSATS